MLLDTRLLDYTDKLNPQFVDKPSRMRWLINHAVEIDQFLTARYREPEDRYYNGCKIFNVNDPLNMMVGYLLVRDFKRSNHEKVDMVTGLIRNMAYVTMCIGKKGGGKTALMAWLSQIMHDIGMPVYWLESTLKLPSWIQQATRLEEVEQGSFVVADEASITANAREAMSQYNRDLSKVLVIARHQNLRVIFCAQHINLTDTNIYRLSDAWLMKRMQMTEAVDMQKNRRSIFLMYLRMMQPTAIEQTLFTNGDEWIVFDNTLAPWWTDEISKSWSKLDYEGAKKIISNAYLNKDEVDPAQLRKQLKARGVSLSDEEIEEIGLDALADYQEKRKGRR